MNILPDDESEGRAFIHVLKNKLGDSYIEQIHGKHVDTRLAEISEKENFAKRTTTDSTRQSCSSPSLTVCQSRKPRLPTCSETLATSKKRFNKEMGLFDFLPTHIDLDKRVIQYFYETCKGPMLELRKEIGLADRWATSFMRIKDLKALKQGAQENSVIDHGCTSFFSRMMFPIDMTDYEEHYIGPGELQDAELGQQREYYSTSNRLNIFGRNDPLFELYYTEEADLRRWRTSCRV